MSSFSQSEIQYGVMDLQESHLLKELPTYFNTTRPAKKTPVSGSLRKFVIIFGSKNSIFPSMPLTWHSAFLVASRLPKPVASACIAWSRDTGWCHVSVREWTIGSQPGKNMKKTPFSRGRSLQHISEWLTYPPKIFWHQRNFKNTWSIYMQHFIFPHVSPNFFPGTS